MSENTTTWKRLDGGYLRADGEWFLVRGAPMSGGGTAWLIHQRVTDERFIGRDAPTAYDTRNGSVLWQIDGDGYPDSASADATGDLYAHDLDAGSLAEAKHTVAVVEAREG